MINPPVLSELEALIGRALKEDNFELVEFNNRYEGRGLALRLLVDKPQGGITMDECAQINRKLGQLLEEKDIIPERYILEVFSPGLDRPMKSVGDFTRCVNKQAVFFLNDKIGGRLEVQGRIVSTGEARVFIDASGEALEIPLAKINKAKLIIQ